MNCIEADNVIDFNQNRKLKMSQEVMENLMAQVEASKQMYNEALNQLFQVRTHNFMLQRQMQAINAKLTEIETAKKAEVNATPVCEELQKAEPAQEELRDTVSAPELENLSA